MKYRAITSLEQFLDILKQHPDKKRLMVWFDLDETLVQSYGENYTDVLIEPDATQELFDYIRSQGIAYTFITARFHDTVCNSKRNLADIRENVYYTIYPFLEKLGIDTEQYYLDDQLYTIRAGNGRTVGIAYKGIIFSGLKGPAIKNYSQQYGLSDRRHIFLDDNRVYLDSVNRHVDDCLIIQRFLPEE